MKKILLIAAVVGLAMASCKKIYTCECTVTTAGVSVTASGDTKEKMTKKDAKAECDKGDSEVTVGGVTTKSSCELK